MRKLKISVGPSPNNIVTYIPGHPISIQGEGFEGELCIFLDSFPIPPNVPRKKFTIQTTGKYKSGSPFPLTYDDVLFGIEFDRPVTWESLPIPRFVIKMCFNWLTRLNDDLVLNAIFYDFSNQELLNESNSERWKKLFSAHRHERPSISAPLVCSASTMNVYPIRNRQDHPHIHPVQREMHNLIDQPRLIWTKHVNHQFTRELNEFNAFMFAGCAPVNYDRTPHDRRLFLRGKQKNTQGIDFKHPLLPPSIPPGPERGHEIRQSYVFEDTIYGFEFFADYFDFESFELRPKLANQAAHSMISPYLLKSLFSGRWRFNVAPYLQDPVRNPDGSWTSSFRMVCKMRNTGKYFWVVKFEMVEYEKV